MLGAVVALAVIGAGVAFAMKGDGKKPASATGSPSASATTPGAIARTGNGPDAGKGDSSAQKPLIAGWQTQSRDKYNFRYDVPPKSAKWQVFSSDTEIAYTDRNGKPIVAMSGTANYREGGCASSGNPNAVGTAGKGRLATIGAQGGAGDVGTHAVNAAGNWGFAAYGGPDHKPMTKVSKPTPWKHNGIDGMTATTTVTNIYQPSPCVPATATARSIAQKLQDGTTAEWVIYADQGVPNALTAKDIDQITSTVRPSLTS